MLMLLAPTASAWDWPVKKDTTSTTGKSGIGSLISGIVGAVTGKKEASIENLAGEWKYQAPAVQFKSDNFLMKAGGAAAQGAIEDKIAPYYKMVGLDRMVLTINEDSTFTIKTHATMSGTMAPVEGQENAYEFQFKAFKKIKLGKMTGFVALKGDELTITYEASKLLDLVDKIASISGLKSAKALGSLLKNYDGLTVGYKLKRQD